MTELGYFLASEEHGPRELLTLAQMAEAAGFEKVSISDHFHPWMDSQGHSPFVWSTIGAIGAGTRVEATTAVTCPILRIQPTILAQAVATSSALLAGGFRFGVGTGERLNEHVLGQHWPCGSARRGHRSRPGPVQEGLDVEAVDDGRLPPQVAGAGDLHGCLIASCGSTSDPNTSRNWP